VTVELLRRLSNAPGVSGFEDAVQEIVREHLVTVCDEVRGDRMGNVIGVRRASGRVPDAGRATRVVVAAHADEIGMMVKAVDAEGYVHPYPLGDLHPPSLVSQRVVIHGREPVQGVVVPRVPNGRPASPKSLEVQPLDEMVIDLGLPSGDVHHLVSVGDPITFAQEFGILNENVYTGRNFDDRIGTYCLLEAMSRLGETAVDVYAVSSVQEEIGIRGMVPAAHAIEAEIGIALDGSLCLDPYSRPHDQTTVMGAGAGIYVIDDRTLGSPRLVSFLFDLAGRHGIPAQPNIGGGTDAEAIQRTHAGALATTMGAPVRYMHSTVQLCHRDDIEATIELLRVFLEHAHELQVAR
jgi:endoglucanase